MKIAHVAIFPFYTRDKHSNNHLPASSVNFSASGNPVPQSYMPQSSVDRKRVTSRNFEWINNPVLKEAVRELNALTFDSKDLEYVKSLGAVPPFESGRAAVDYIYESNTRIKFSQLPSANVHAQYDYENNFIIINEIYKNTQNKAEILAIAEAILHESGHGKDKDSGNSVQEEIDCLSMNAISHRAFMKKYPAIFSNSEALIIKDGVCVYSDLFFDSNPEKLRLIERVKTKYSFLPAGDFVHPPSNLAMRIKMS